MNDIKKDKYKKAVRRWLGILFLLAFCMIYAIGIARYLDPILSLGSRLGALFLSMLCIVFAINVQIIIHEAGHLVFGLFCGYRFQSFRIFSFMLIKKKDGLRLKRYALAGTAGQCLMLPPEMTDGSMPYVIYNMGGVFMNLISAAIFSILFLLTRDSTLQNMLCCFLSITGVVYALMNGIPMNIGTVDNDGYNALNLGKSPEALRSLWLQLKINGMLSSGIRLRNMPEDWFAAPSDAGMKNPLIATIAVFACNRAMDQMDFETAERLGTNLLYGSNGVAPLHQFILSVELIYCELIGNEPQRGFGKIQDE